MKTVIIFLTVLGLGFSLPRPKAFHDHVEDFLDIIYEEAEDELDDLFNEYLKSEEFTMTLEYTRTADFKNLVYEMESLPEFKAVTDFLENNGIDILYFIDLVNSAVEQNVPRTRQQTSGKDFRSFIADSITLFPKSKLSALFEQKMVEEEDFRTAIENLQSEEWEIIWSALWENEIFKTEAQILLDNGIDLIVLLDEIMAIFGQN